MHSCYHMWNENKSSHKKIVYWRIIQQRNSYLSSTYFVIDLSLRLSFGWLAGWWTVSPVLFERENSALRVFGSKNEEKRFNIFRSKLIFCANECLNGLNVSIESVLWKCFKHIDGLYSPHLYGLPSTICLWLIALHKMSPLSIVNMQRTDRTGHFVYLQ